MIQIYILRNVELVDWIFISKMEIALISVQRGITLMVAVASRVKRVVLNVGNQMNALNAMIHFFSKKQLARRLVQPVSLQLPVISVYHVELVVIHAQDQPNRNCF